MTRENNTEAQSQEEKEHPPIYRIYVGTYTQGSSQGIYGFTFNFKTMQLEKLGLLAEALNPSYLAISDSNTNLNNNIDADKHVIEDKKILFAVFETDRFSGQEGGGVGSFLIDENTGALSLISVQKVSGKAPCHICLAEEQKNLYTANYNGGSVSRFVYEESGIIHPEADTIQHQGFGPNKERQEQAHTHFVAVTPDKKNLMVADLGIDQILIYPIDAATGTLLQEGKKIIETPKGSGPRHLAFHPQGLFFYVVNELDCSILTYSVHEQNFDKNIQKITTLSKEDYSVSENGFQGKTTICSAIKITPNGKFLYVANRGADQIAGYRIQKDTGLLELIGHTSSGGNWPRDIEIDPLGKFLFVANQESHVITIFTIEEETGVLFPTELKMEIDYPVCIKTVEFQISRLQTLG